MIRSIQQIEPIRPVMLEKTPTLNLNALPDFIFLMIFLLVIYRISESVVRRTPGYTKEDKKTQYIKSSVLLLCQVCKSGSDGRRRL